MIQGGLVYIYSDESPSSILGCGSLIEGPFIVTCRHVWDQAVKAAGDKGPVLVRFPPRGEGDDVFRPAKLADSCQDGARSPDLVILDATDIPSGSAALALPLARTDTSECGDGYALAGLIGRRPDEPYAPEDQIIEGKIVAFRKANGLRQFTGKPSGGYWTDRGSSGSPLCLKDKNELAGILCQSETGKRPGEASIHEAFVLPATTIHRWLRRHVGRRAALARGIDPDKADGILDIIGAADAGIAEVQRRFSGYLDAVEAHTVERHSATKNGADTDAAIEESERLTAAFEPVKALGVLERTITEEARKQRLLPLLAEKVRQQRLVFNHAGAIETMTAIGCLGPDQVWNWFALGNVNRLIGDREAALRAYRTGQRAADRVDDDRGRLDGYHHVGDVLLLEGDREGAMAAFRASLVIAQTAAARDPSNANWQRDLSSSHTRIGDVLLLERDCDGAMAAFRASLAIDQALTARDPGNAGWQRDLSVSHMRTGDVLLLEGDRDGAMTAFRASLAIRQALTARDPGNARWQRDLSVSHTKIGDVLLLEGERDGAMAAFRASLAICEALAARDPGNAGWQRDLSVSHTRIGDVLLLEGDRDGAMTAFRASLAIDQALTARDPGNARWQRDLSVSHTKIGDVLLLEGERDGAMAAFRASLAICEALAARDPGNADWQRDLSVIHTRIGDVLLLEGDRDGAMTAFRASLAICQTLAAHDPGNTGWQRELSVSHTKIGDVLLQEGDRDGAMAAFRDTLAICHALTARDPGNANWQRDLSVSHTKIGDVLLLEGERDGAMAAFNTSLAICQALAARDPGNADWQQNLSAIHTRIGDLLLEGDRGDAMATPAGRAAPRSTHKPPN